MSDAATESRAFPFAETPDTVSAEDARVARVSGGTGLVNILIVDDRPENLLALEAILEPLGQHIVRALSGAEALKHILRQDFAVILLDVQMPGMNGFETAELVKSRERSKYIPIIFLTAISKEEEYVFRGYSVGAVDYLFKPFHPDVLRSKVSVFVDLYLKQEQLRHQAQLLRESERRKLEVEHLTKLLESEARTAEIVGSAMDAIVTFDDAGVVTMFNAAAERMFGRSSAAALGKQIADLFPEREREAAVDALKKRAIVSPVGSALDERPEAPPEAASSSEVLPLTGRRRGGEEFPLEASVSCLGLGGGCVYTLIVRDVSERRRAEEALRTQAISLANTTDELKALNDELNRRQLELEQAMSARNRFYASMSHELRTPINAIIGYNTLLLDNIYGPLNERQVMGLQRTHRAAKHLLELVNDILDLSKIEAGKIELSLQPVNFPAVIEDLFVTVRPLAEEQSTTLELDHTGEAATIISDARRVRQILLNLISNAIKFGQGKPIIVQSRTHDDGGITISVTDHGPGIAPEDLPRIFDEFVQLAQAQQIGGTGLGLPISKRLALLLNGRLEAESVVGKGSSFRLILPHSADGVPVTRAPRGERRDTIAAPARPGLPPGPAEAEKAEPPADGSVPQPESISTG